MVEVLSKYASSRNDKNNIMKRSNLNTNENN